MQAQVQSRRQLQLQLRWIWPLTRKVGQKIRSKVKKRLDKPAKCKFT